MPNTNFSYFATKQSLLQRRTLMTVRSGYRICAYTLTIALLAGIFVGCPPQKRSGMQQSKSSKTELWKRYNVPPGADPSVPDSLGGAGFERIAAQLGFTTYVPTPDELHYFGDPRARTGGEIHIISNQFPATFRPVGQNSNTVYNTEINNFVYETLLSTHPVTRDFIPALASHWKISDDKLTFTFRIDPNARFSNGLPVTAEDVRATWRLLMDESILEPALQVVYSKYEEPEVLSKYLVRVRCKTKNFRNLLYFAASMQILCSAEIGNLTGDEFLDRYNYNMPSGTGEYIVLEQDVKLGKRYVLTRRDDYWAKDYPTARFSGNFDRIIYEVITDNPIVEYERFKKGQADVFRFTMATTLKWLGDTTSDPIRLGWIRRVRVYTDGPMGTGGYAFNMRKPPFNDIRVRKAFAYLLPREQIIQKLLFGEYEPYDTQYPGQVYANPTNPKVTYNPELANRLLDEAGWHKRNEEGIRTKNGQPFRIELSITPPQARYVTPYQQELRKAGIDLQLKYEDWTTLIKNIDARNFSIFYFGYSGLLIPNPETSLRSDLADKSDNNNIQGVKSKEIDALIAAYDTAFAFRDQVRIIRAIDSICAQMWFNVYTWNPRGLRVAYWDKFGMPEYILPRFTQLSYVYSTIAGTWWYDPDKAARLQRAIQTGQDLGGPKGIIEARYWKELAARDPRYAFQF